MTANPKNQSNILKRLAEDNGVAISIVDGSSREISVSNNNSMCDTLWYSADFAAECDKYCGKAYESATEARGVVDYVCHAGLSCKAVPVEQNEKQLVAIIGRTFQKAENYRAATEKAISGDWRQFPPTTFFENVMFSGTPQKLERLEDQLRNLREELIVETDEPANRSAGAVTRAPGADQRTQNVDDSLRNYNFAPDPAAETHPDPFETSMVNAKLELFTTPLSDDIADREAWRSFIPSLLTVSYRLACRRILEFLSRHYGIESSLWLQRDGSQFDVAAVFGDLEDKPMRIDISADDKRIRAAMRDDSPIVLKELRIGSAKKPRIIQLFPVVIGGEVRNALGIARDGIDAELSGRILKFCRYVASRLEILRLRETVAESKRTSRVLKEFNEQLRNIDAENFWQKLTVVSAELVGAERASLLVRGPAMTLSAKGSIGSMEDISLDRDLGSRVARTILDKGRPALVMDAAKVSLDLAPERNYKSTSFISYPITLGGRGIGVMNFTDKTDREPFDKDDLDALDSIAPQIAVAVDRMLLLDKMDGFAKLSVTDPLTGLLNRRYIEERLAEEINRSGRSGEPLSFLMLDVDDFKSYNDNFGHPAGDEALRIVGGILREDLRGADVAVRYGGEEFSVLLPATNIDEAAAIAERIRVHMAQTEFPKRKVTISIGVASRSDAINSVDDLILAADKALFRAKKNGRNNIQIYSPELDGGEIIH